MVMLLLMTSLAFCQVLSHSEDDPPPSVMDTLDFKEELLNVRGEMYSYSFLPVIIQQLTKEVRQLRAEAAENTKLLAAIQDKMSGNHGEMEARFNLIRDEVRLISQHKLTWANSSYAGGRLVSDYLVDGVYRMTHDEGGMNPIQHTDDAKQGPNNMVMIDLGATFKIHTVKLWKRTHTCCDQRNVGLQIYADDTLIGSTYDVRYLYTIPVTGGRDVYGNKIYVKRPLASTVNFLEIQVFGTGPF